MNLSFTFLPNRLRREEGHRRASKTGFLSPSLPGSMVVNRMDKKEDTFDESTFRTGKGRAKRRQLSPAYEHATDGTFARG